MARGGESLLALNHERKTTVIDSFKIHSGDTGSPEVQIALLSERINFLSGHLGSHKKDFTSRVGLMRLVGKRKRLLSYLKREDPARYDQLIKKLSLRK